MASKTFQLAEVGDVVVIKRSSSRHLRLSISNKGQIRVSIPTWAPYRSGVDFADSKRSWIEQQMPKLNKLVNGQPIGRGHHLNFKVDATAQTIRSRLTGNLVTITFPSTLNSEHPDVQEIANKAAVKALRNQAEQLLPKRLESLSQNHQMTYKDVRIKRLTRRWGSCDQNKQIVLNLYLIQLPWELIDYVILHELAHTRHLNHGPDFWSKLESMLPDARARKRQMHSYHPGIIEA